MKKFILVIFVGINPVVLPNPSLLPFETLKKAPPEIIKVMESSPRTYTFKSRFTSETSVFYTGQVFRNVLMAAIKNSLNSYTRGNFSGNEENVANIINSYYQYSSLPVVQGPGIIDGLSEINISAKDISGSPIPTSEYVYDDIQESGKDLKSKMAGIDNPLRNKTLLGWRSIKTPHELIQSLIALYAKNTVSEKPFSVPNGTNPKQSINESHITADGLDISQIIQKFLYGAISFSQTAGDYLSTDLGPTKGINADNTNPAKQGAPYTALEHHFDEAFGYWGAARDFLNYSDQESMKKLSIDTNRDGLIQIKEEKNLGMSVNASRVDKTAFDQDINLSNEIMLAFLKGRHLITKRPTNYEKYLKANVEIILNGIEKTYAALTIHYINKTLNEYSEYGTTKYLYKDFVKFWSELKGYALAFQFRPKAIMSTDKFTKIHSLLGIRPVLPHEPLEKVALYKKQLSDVRSELKGIYNFSNNNIMNW